MPLVDVLDCRSLPDLAVLIELDSIRTANDVRCRTLPVAVKTLPLKTMGSIRTATYVAVRCRSNRTHGFQWEHFHRDR